MQFKGYFAVQALLDSSSKVNAITPAYTAVLGLHIYPTNVGAQKIDRSMLSTYNIVFANF